MKERSYSGDPCPSCLRWIGLGQLFGGVLRASAVLREIVYGKIKSVYWFQKRGKCRPSATRSVQKKRTNLFSRPPAGSPLREKGPICSKGA